MTAPVVRIAGAADAPALAALRRAWTAEQQGHVDDEGFEARFLDWYERESARRVSWVAEVSGVTGQAQFNPAVLTISNGTGGARVTVPNIAAFYWAP